MRTSFDFPTTNFGSDYNNINVSIDFNKGGINYFTYKHENKGIYVHVNVEKLSRERGFTCRSFTAFDNVSFKVCVLPLERKSTKKLMQLAERLERHAEQIACLIDEKKIDDAVRYIAENIRI